MVKAGRYKFLPMFYGFNHPIYQELEYHDLANQIQYTKELKELLDQNVSFTSSNLDYNHQGADFSLEGKIKRHKMVAPKGIVTNERWKRVSRSIDKIESICKYINASLGFTDENAYSDVNLYSEIMHWRAVLRRSEMIANPEAEGVVRNIYNEPINPVLESLTEILNEKMFFTWNRVLQGKQFAKNMCVYIQIKEALDVHMGSESSSDSSDDDI